MIAIEIAKSQAGKTVFLLNPIPNSLKLPSVLYKNFGSMATIPI